MPEWSAARERSHPDTERLSAYVDGTLDVRARAKAEEHVAQCEDCYELVVEITRSQEVFQPSPARGNVLPFTGRRWLHGASVLLAAAALFVIVLVPSDWWSRWRGQGGGGRFEQLAAAMGDTRPTEGRLTGGFRYGRLRSPSRSVDANEDNLSLLAAAGEIQRVVEVNASLVDRHAYGVALVLLGRYDEAIALLEQLVGEDGANSRYHTDLAAAYIARAPTAIHADDWPRALAAADRALSVNRSLVEAHFNRALALVALKRTEQARAAWAAYLTFDASSPWADEARRRLQDLETAPRSQ